MRFTFGAFGAQAKSMLQTNTTTEMKINGRIFYTYPLDTALVRAKGLFIKVYPALIPFPAYPAVALLIYLFAALAPDTLATNPVPERKVPLKAPNVLIEIPPAKALAIFGN